MSTRSLFNPANQMFEPFIFRKNKFSSTRLPTRLSTRPYVIKFIPLDSDRLRDAFDTGIITKIANDHLQYARSRLRQLGLEDDSKYLQERMQELASGSEPRDKRDIELYLAGQKMDRYQAWVDPVLRRRMHVVAFFADGSILCSGKVHPDWVRKS